jgi:Glycosyltransferase family 87
MRDSRGREVVGGVALAFSTALVLVVLSHVVGRVYPSGSVSALNGWSMPHDLGVFLQAGDDVLAGRSPYPDPATFSGEANYVYPPPLAVVMAPLSAVPERLVETLFTLLGIAAIFAALRLLDVRDLRCYPLALLYPVTHESLRNGALGTFLVLIVAVLWRYRDRAATAGTAAGAAVALKLFLWPILIWLWFTGRARALIVGVLAGAGLSLGSWAAIGFAGLSDYPTLLRKLAELESDSSFSLVAYGHLLGLPAWTARLLAVVVGVGLLVFAHRNARHGQGNQHQRDRLSLTLVLGAALALTPILWLHYLALLLIPVALARPRLSALWFLPLVMWLLTWRVSYTGVPDGDVGQMVTTLAVVIAVFGWSLSSSPPESSRSGRRATVRHTLPNA